MNTLRPFFPIAAIAALLTTGILYAQDKPGDSSGPCCEQSEPSRTVMVNGIAEPVYRTGTKGISLPRPTYRPSAEYSEKARKLKIQGQVILSAVVTSAGELADIKVTKSLGYGLDEKAMEPLRRWKFQPAMKDGKPVSVEITIEQDFHLY